MAPQDEYELLLYVTIITCNILQRAIFGVSFLSRAKSRKQFQNNLVLRAIPATRGHHLVFVCPDYP